MSKVNEFTYVNDHPIICHETIFQSEENYVDIRGQVYGRINAPIYLELKQMSTPLLLDLNTIYAIRLQYLYSCTEKWNEYMKVIDGQLECRARLVTFNSHYAKFFIIKWEFAHD